MRLSLLLRIAHGLAMTNQPRFTSLAAGARS